jgi:hypothetical protein
MITTTNLSGEAGQAPRPFITMSLVRPLGAVVG